MQLLIRHDNFSTKYYDLQIQNRALVFAGEDNTFHLPYSEVKDFSITQDRRKKPYFTVLCSGRIVEGQILELTEIEPFLSAIKERLNGIVQIEVRKSRTQTFHTVCS